MGYHPQRNCKKCRSKCISIYEKLWHIKDRRWTMLTVGYRCIKNKHTVYFPEDKDYSIRKPKPNAK